MTNESTKTLYVVYTNTDLTEGRGKEYPIHYCELEATANRLSKRKYVQGSDAPIQKVAVISIDGCWYLSTKLLNIEAPTQEDKKEQLKIDTLKAVVEKAKAAGLTFEEINILKGL